MSRTPKIVPSVKVKISFPVDVLAKLNLHLYSELEGKVPFAAHQRFFVDRITEYFNNKHLDLAPYVTGAAAGSLIISGHPEVISILKGLLK